MTVTVTGVLGQVVYDVLALFVAWFVLRFSVRAFGNWMYMRERRRDDAAALKKFRADEEARWERNVMRKRRRRSR